MLKSIFIFVALFFPFVGMADDFAILDMVADTDFPETVELNKDAQLATVSNFDISGIMLGMSFEDVYNAIHGGNAALYSMRPQDSTIYTIWPDWKYNLDYECRQNGVVIPEQLEKCINGLAKDRGLLYASEIHLVRPSTNETIDVYFTSNATDNVVWRIVYINDVDRLEGIGAKFDDQREKRIMNFWQNVLDKYGAPNSGTDKWISTTNAYDPMMTAYYGELDLVDNGIHISDQAKNVQQSRENFRGKSYAF